MKKFYRTKYNYLSTAILDALNHYGGRADLQTIKNWVTLVHKLNPPIGSVSSSITHLVRDGYIIREGKAHYKINCELVQDYTNKPVEVVNSNGKVVTDRYKAVWESEGNNKNSMVLNLLIASLFSAESLVDAESCEEAINELNRMRFSLRKTNVKKSNKKYWLVVISKALDICERDYKAFIT